MSLLDRFIRRPILGTPPKQAYTDERLAELKARAERAAALLRSDAFVAAYQSSLDTIIDEMLALTVTDLDAPSKALRLVAKAQALRELVGDMNRTVNEWELEDRKRQPNRVTRISA